MVPILPVPPRPDERLQKSPVPMQPVAAEHERDVRQPGLVLGILRRSKVPLREEPLGKHEQDAGTAIVGRGGVLVEMLDRSTARILLLAQFDEFKFRPMAKILR